MAPGKARQTDPPGRCAAAGRRRGSQRGARSTSFPSQKVAKHYIIPTPLRTSALRTLGGYANVFALESFMDEVAPRPARILSSFGCGI